MNKQMTKQKHQKAEIQTYRIAFGGDGLLYSVSFKAAMDRLETDRVLAVACSSLYENIPEAIRRCLDSSGLEYSDFVSGAAYLEHEKIMAFADCLLHDNSCNCLDRLAGKADSYYGIMDHQRRTGENCCEGCYYAVSRTVSGKNNTAERHVIGQTFWYDTSSGMENSYFAIRKNNGDSSMHTLEATASCPILSLFGCVDVAGLLMNINTITTKEQASKIANR